MSSRVADVLIPLALDTAYSYAVPDGLVLAEGDVVQVPLGTRETVGVVWSLRPGAGANFKPVSLRLAAPPIAPAMRKFLDWIAWYTLRPEGLGPRPRPEAARRAAGPRSRASASASPGRRRCA